MRNMNIRRNRLAVTAGTALLALGVAGTRPASATPSTLGAFPSTDTVADKGFHLDVDTYGAGLKTNGTDAVGLTYGFGNKDGAFGRSEIGLDYAINFGGLAADKRVLFNAKTQLWNNDGSKTKIVAGVWGVGSKTIGAPNYIYLQGSKSFEWGRVHLGVASALASKATIAAPSGKGDRTSITLGYDKALTEKIGFAVDFYSGKNLYSGIQPTLYYAVNDKASFGLGWFRANDSTVFPSRNQTYICFDYNFDMAKK